MAEIKRTASGTWQGNLKQGRGMISGASDVLKDVPYSFATRFENAPGTNPEELIAAAHAACFSMAFSNYLDGQGHEPQLIITKATISLDNGVIGKVHLETEGRVADLDEETFKQFAVEAEEKCPVSNLLRSGLEVTLDATLKR